MTILPIKWYSDNLFRLKRWLVLMKYETNIKSVKVVMIALLMFFAVLLICGIFIFAAAFINDPSYRMIPAAFSLLVMLTVFGVIYYSVLHSIVEVEWDNYYITFTYFNNKKESISVYDVFKIKVYTTSYVLKTNRKEYIIEVKFNTASMKHETIEFIDHLHFPKTKFENGWL